MSDDLKLTWDDLIVDNITSTEAANWLTEWEWLVTGRLAPIFLSRFGNWFFHRPDGAIEMLDVCEGTIERMAQDYSQFQAAVNTREWQEEYLYSALVLKYRRDGIIALERNAIGFAPHPVLAASFSSCQVTVMSMKVWQSICGQTLRQVRQG